MICRKGKMNDDESREKMNMKVDKSVFYFKVKVEYVNDRKKTYFQQHPSFHVFMFTIGGVAFYSIKNFSFIGSRLKSNIFAMFIF